LRMGSYEDSRWADSDFSENYRTHADAIIQERRRLIGVLSSFYGHFMGGRSSVDVLDLGCGDGTLTRVLMDGHANIRPTLVDASPDMLKKAGELLRDKKEANLVRASFQELMAGSPKLPGFGFIFSSLAIHHLDTDSKKALYRYAYDHLEPGGYFVNIDVVLPPSEALEVWYLDIWRDWIRATGGPVDDDVPSSFKGNADNQPDSLGLQLEVLKMAGFKDVDCFYKNGIFAVFGGLRQAY
jgi:tRNA (cmo5U34)-methyltransferase